MNVGLNPGGKILGEGSFDKGVIAGSQSGYKDLGFMNLPRLRIRDLHGLPGIVDEQLFSSPVNLSEAGSKLLGPVMVNPAKLTILVALRILLLVLLPEKLKRPPLLLQLLVKILRGRHLTLFLNNRMRGRKKKMLQRGFIQL
jgi:hypothetical protein